MQVGILNALANVAVLIAYCVSAFSAGAVVLQWLRRWTGEPLALSGIARVALSFLFGIGIFATVWLLLGLVGMLTAWLIWLIGAVCILVGRHECVRALSDSIRDVRAIWTAFTAEPLLWKIFEAALVAKLLTIPFLSLFHSINGDAAHYNMPIVKAAAFLGEIKTLPVLATLHQSLGLLGETNFIALAILRGMVPADLLTGIVLIAGAVMLLALTHVLGAGIRGCAIALAMLLGTVPIYYMLSNGTVHVFSLSLALASAFCLVATRNVPVTGILSGFSVVAAVSNAVVFWPALAAILLWQHRFDIIGSRVEKLTSVTLLLFRFGCWCAIPVLIHRIGTWVLAGTPFPTGFGGLAIWGSHQVNSADAMSHYLPLYPFAAVFGQFSTQGLTLSYLVLMFLPFGVWLAAAPKGTHKFTAGKLALAATVGLICWIVIFPSVLVTRYILATYLLFVPLAARGAEIFSYQNKPSRSYSIYGLLVLLLCIHPILQYRLPLEPQSLAQSWAILTETAGVCGKNASQHRPRGTGCDDMQALNNIAVPGDRVLVHSYYLYWLRPEIMLCAASYDEVNLLLGSKTPGAFWRNLRARGFKYVYLDGSYGSDWNPPGGFDHPPSDMTVTEFLKSETVRLYRLEYPELSQCSLCTDSSGGGRWRVSSANSCSKMGS